LRTGPGPGPGETFGSLARDYDTDPGYRQGPPPPAARGNPQLYAVPDAARSAYPADTQSRSGQFAQFIGEQSGPFGFDREQGPANGGSPATGQMLAVAGNPAATATYEAYDQADAIRRAAEDDAERIRREAATQAAALQRDASDQATSVRQAAEQEAAELRTALLAMSGELGRAATFVSENLGSPSGLATMPPPALSPATAPAIEPPRPRTRPDAPASRPARPAGPRTRPDGPAGRSAAPPRPRTRPDAPAIRPAGPRTTPGEKSQKRPRQYQAMRVATVATAALFAFAAVTGAAEIGLHGFKFFTFRGGGVGETGGDETDQQFQAKQAPKPAPVKPHVEAPKGRHVVKSH
jgi:hypothetical protein